MNKQMKGNIGYLYNNMYFENYTGQSNHNFSSRKENIIKASKTLINETAVPGATESFTLSTIYPGLIAGSGYEHEVGGKHKEELKFGCFFDYTTGMPIIPGSSIKGVIRSAFPQEGISKNTDDTIKEYKAAFICDFLCENKSFEKNGEQNIIKAFVNALEKDIFEGTKKSIYNRDIFHDAHLTEKNYSKKFLETDVLAPHKKKTTQSPDVLQFLKVLPEVSFNFSFTLHDSIISLNGENFKVTADNKKKLFKHIILHLGLGAKTNVGYGQFKE